MASTLAPFFESRETRANRLPSSVRDQFKELESKSLDPEFGDRQFTAIWMASKMGTNRKDVLANYDAIANRMFGDGMTPGQIYDKITETYQFETTPEPKEEEAPEAQQPDAPYVPKIGTPAAPKGALMYPTFGMDRGPGFGNMGVGGVASSKAIPFIPDFAKKIGSGSSEMVYKTGAGLTAQSEGITKMVSGFPTRPVLAADPEFAKLRDEASQILDYYATSPYDEPGSYQPVPTDAEEARLKAIRSKQRAISKQLDAEYRNDMREWLKTPAAAASKQMRKITEQLLDMADEMDNLYNVDPKFAETTAGQVAGYVGSLPTTVALAVIPYAGPVLIESLMFTDVEQDRAQTEGEDYDRDKAFIQNVATASMQAAVEKAFGLEVLFGKVLAATPKKHGRVVFRDYVTTFFREGSKSAVAEGLTEPTQGFIQDMMATISFDEGRELVTGEAAKRRLMEAAIGAAGGFLMGGGIATAADIDQGRGVNAGDEYLTTKDGEFYSEVDFRIMRRLKTDEEIKAMAPDPATGELLLSAANGNKVSIEEYNNKVADKMFVEIDGIELDGPDMGGFNGSSLGMIEGAMVFKDAAGQYHVLDLQDPKQAAFVEQFKATVADQIRQQVRNETAALMNSRLEEGRKLIVDEETTKVVQDFVDEGKITAEEAVKRLEVARDVNNKDAGMDPAAAKVFGVNEAEYRNNLFTDVSRVFQGSTPLDVIEEVSEGYIKKRLALKDLDQAELKAWREKYAADTGVVNKGEDTISDIEWFSKRVIDYAVGNRKLLGMPTSWGNFLRSLGEHLKAVLKLSTTMKKLQRDGKLDTGFESALKGAIGIIPVEQAQTEVSDARAQRQAELDAAFGGQRKPDEARRESPEAAGRLNYDLRRQQAEANAVQNISAQLSVQAERMMEMEGYDTTFSIAKIGGQFDSTGAQVTSPDAQQTSKSSTVPNPSTQADATGTDGSSRFRVNPATRGRSFREALERTRKEHPQGAAVAVYELETYLNPENLLFQSEDQLGGVMVTSYGDLQSVHKVPGSTAKMKAVLAEASEYASTLDAFDIGGFLPNLYGQFKFAQVARVKFSREYAPDGWNYETMGEPDVVFMVRDTDDVLKGIEVPTFEASEYEAAAAVQAKAKAKVADAADAVPDVTFSITAKDLSVKPPRGVNAIDTGALPIWNIPKRADSLTKVITNPKSRDAFYKRLDSALNWLRKDPSVIATSSGWVQFMRKAGVWGEVPMPPTGLAELFENPAGYVEKLNGGYHGDRSIAGTQKSAKQGLDGTVEMRSIIGEGKAPAEWAVALHHMWGVLSRMLPPIHQEGMWLRLISHRPVLDAIQSSIDGTFSLTLKQWSGLVLDARKATKDGAGQIGNAATANANAFYLMLKNLNGRWSDAADVYAAPNAKEMGRKFWALDAGALGIKNKVQRFIGLTFGVPGVIMDRWKFVEFWLPSAMEGVGHGEPKQYFKYSENVPGDPVGVYGVYGGVDASNTVLSLAMYEALETSLQAAIDASPELQAHLGKHANPGGLHWHGWNAIKNEAVGHSSLDLTKDLMREYGVDIDANKVHDFIRNGSYFTEGSENRYTNSKVILDRGQIRVERTVMASGLQLGGAGVQRRGAKTGTDGSRSKGVKTTFSTSSAKDDIALAYELSGQPVTEAQQLKARWEQINAKRLAAATDLLNRQINKLPIPERVERAQKTGEATMAAQFLVPVSGRLQRISRPLAQRLRRFEFDLGVAIKDDLEKVTPFMEGFKRMSKEDAQTLDLALKNGDVETRNTVLDAYNLREAFSAVIEVLNETRKRGEAAGYDIGEIEDYYPRRVIDYEGLRQFYAGDATVDGEIDRAITEAAKKARADGRELTREERIEVVNRTLQRVNRAASKPGNFKGRVTDIVSVDASQFYADSATALIGYIESTNKAIEQRRFFGKYAIEQDGATDESSKVLAMDASIGGLVDGLIADGLITPAQQEQVVAILSARFNYAASSGKIQAFKTLGYMTTMGQVTSAITQFGDLMFSLYESGAFNTMVAGTKAAVRQSNVTVKGHLGLENVAREFDTDITTLSKLLDGVFTITGLRYIDMVGKETLINARFRQISQQAKKGKISQKTAQLLETTFGQEKAAEVLEDFAEGIINDDTVFAVYSVLADYQPISLSEYPQGYLENPNGRVFYMLKTFTLKQLESFRREGLDDIVNGNLQQKASGFRRLLHLAGLFYLGNIPVDWIKDWLMGRDPQLEDIMVDNLFKLMGISRWHVWNFRYRKNPLEFAMQLAMPAAPFLTYPLLDIEMAAKQIAEGEDIKPGKFNTWRIIPVGGSPIYWWAGGGADKVEERREEREGIGSRNR